MFDNLRDSSLYDDEQSELYQEPEVQTKPVATARRRRKSRFMGMSAQQRFILSFMLLIMVCVMGMLALYVSGRIGFF
jgi:hypothetical protein